MLGAFAKGISELAERDITERGEEFVRIDTQVLYNEISMACMFSLLSLYVLRSHSSNGN